MLLIQRRIGTSEGEESEATAGCGGWNIRGIRRRRTRAGRRRKPSRRKSEAKAAGFTDGSVGRTWQDANQAGAFVAELRTMGW